MRAVASVPAEEVAQFGVVAKLWALACALAEVARDIPTEFRGLWHIWIYDSEVKNGGHLQFFHNQGDGGVPATLVALREIGAEDHALLLEQCWSAAGRAPVPRVKSLEEYAEMALEGSFEAEDHAYYRLPDVCDLLAAHKEGLLNEVVEVRV